MKKYRNIQTGEVVNEDFYNFVEKYTSYTFDNRLWHEVIEVNNRPIAEIETRCCKLFNRFFLDNYNVKTGITHKVYGLSDLVNYHI